MEGYIVHPDIDKHIFRLRDLLRIQDLKNSLKLVCRNNYRDNSCIMVYDCGDKVIEREKLMDGTVISDNIYGSGQLNYVIFCKNRMNLTYKLNDYRYDAVYPNHYFASPEIAEKITPDENLRRYRYDANECALREPTRDHEVEDISKLRCNYYL